MKPIYFPYTFISRQTALELAVFFNNFVVYRPSDDPLPAEMQTLADSGLLDVQIPDVCEASRFRDIYNNLKRWGSQQGSGDEIKAAVLQTRTETPALYDEQATSRIKAELRRQLKPARADDSMDPTLQARVFLAFAQEFDREHQEISGDIGAYRDKVRRMLADMSAEGDNPLREPLSELQNRRRDVVDYMLPERVNAWLRLNDQTSARTGILVTSNSKVLEYLSSRIPAMVKIHEFSSAAVSAVDDENHATWQRNLLDYLIELTRGHEADESKQPPELSQPADRPASLSMSVFLIANLTPRDCLAISVSPTSPDAGGSPLPSNETNTVIALIRPSEPFK